MLFNGVVLGAELQRFYDVVVSAQRFCTFIVGTLKSKRIEELTKAAEIEKGYARRYFGPEETNKIYQHKSVFAFNWLNGGNLEEENATQRNVKITEGMVRSSCNQALSALERIKENFSNA